MKLIKYSEFNISESKYDKAEYFRLVEGLEAHYEDMLYKGETNDQINEGIWDLLSSLGTGFEGRLKNYAAGWLLKKLGLPSDNNFLSNWAKNVVELIDFRNITNYFGGGSCKYWADAISKALGKTIAEAGLDALLGGIFGINVNFNSGVMGTIAGTIRDTLELSVLSSDFVNKLTQKLDGTVCGEGTSFTSVFGGGKITPKTIANAEQNKTQTDQPTDTNTSDTLDMAKKATSILGFNK